MRPHILIAGVFLSLFASPATGLTGEWSFFLDSNTISDIAVDGSYLWCATNGGLVRWNTRNMSHTLFTVEDGLQDQALTEVGVGPDGSVWVGSEECSEWGGNLSVSKDLHWTVFQDENGPGKCISSIAFAPDGSVWVGANNTVYMCGEPRAVHRYDGESWSRYDPNEDLFFAVSDIAADPEGNVWVGSWRSGLLRYDGSAWTAYTTDDGLPALHISAVAVDSTNSVWAGTSRGLSRFDGATWTTYTVADGLSNDFIRSIVVAPDGMVWVGTDSGVSRFDGEQWISFSRADGLPADVITSIAVSPDGTVWAGTSQGLGRYDGQVWTVWHTDDGPISNGITAITAARDGTLWYGAKKGVIQCFDGASWSEIPALAELNQYSIDALVFDSRGYLWIGAGDSLRPTPNLKIFRFDGTSLVAFPYEGEPIRSNAEDLAIDRDDGVWIATEKGLYYHAASGPDRFERATGMPYPEDWYLSVAFGPDGTIWASGRTGVYSRNVSGIWSAAPPMEGAEYLETDSRGTVYAASFREGGFRLEGNSWTPLPVPGNITALFVDSRDRLWVGTQGPNPNYGLQYLDIYCLDGNTWTTYRMGNSTNGAKITHFTESPNGDIWVSSHGLYRFSPNPANRVDDEEYLPESLVLVGNYPNPFNPSTTISFTLPEPGKAELTVYDITGRKVRSLLSGPMAAGTHSVIWDGRDEAGKPASSGVYLSRLEAGGRAHSAKNALDKVTGRIRALRKNELNPARHNIPPSCGFVRAFRAFRGSGIPAFSLLLSGFTARCRTSSAC